VLVLSSSSPSERHDADIYHRREATDEPKSVVDLPLRDSNFAPRVIPIARKTRKVTASMTVSDPYMVRYQGYRDRMVPSMSG